LREAFYSPPKVIMMEYIIINELNKGEFRTPFKSPRKPENTGIFLYVGVAKLYD